MLKILRSAGQRVKGLTGWLLLACFILENHPAVCSPSNWKQGEIDFLLAQAGVLPQTTGERLSTQFFSVKKKNTADLQKKIKKNLLSASARTGHWMHGA